MWLIVGLGNPGKEYAGHRHNIGFMAIDRLLASAGNPPEKNLYKSQVCQFTLHSDDNKKSEKVITCKPQTYMNLSGDPVQALMAFYKIEQQNLVVLHDEVDFPFNVLKVQKERGHGGHNGIRDIHEKLGDNKYFRIKMGIGRPDGKMDMSSHVLGNFSKEQLTALPDFLDTALDAVESLMFNGYEKTATKFNTPSPAVQPK